jgi:hypothetical protein
VISGDVYRRGEKATFIADLPNFRTWYVTEVQNQKTRLASIQEP